MQQLYPLNLELENWTSYEYLNSEKVPTTVIFVYNIKSDILCFRKKIQSQNKLNMKLYEPLPHCKRKMTISNVKWSEMQKCTLLIFVNVYWLQVINAVPVAL